MLNQDRASPGLRTCLKCMSCGPQKYTIETSWRTRKWRAEESSSQSNKPSDQPVMDEQEDRLHPLRDEISWLVRTTAASLSNGERKGRSRKPAWLPWALLLGRVPGRWAVCTLIQGERRPHQVATMRLNCPAAATSLCLQERAGLVHPASVTSICHLLVINRPGFLFLTVLTW